MSFSSLTQVPSVQSLSMSPPLVCAPDDLVVDVALRIRNNKMDCILVYDDSNNLVGIITTKDIALRGIEEKNSRAIDIATTEPIVVGTDMLVVNALEIMVKSSIRHLPIKQHETNEIIGIVDITKCFHQAMLRLEQLAKNNEKLNDVVKDFMENDATFERNLILQSISKLIHLMEAPDLESILNSPNYCTIPIIVNPSTTVTEALSLMRHHNTTAVLIRDETPNTAAIEYACKTAHVCVEKEYITNDFNIIGIFTSKDVVYRVLNNSQEIDPNVCSLARVMTTRPNYALKGLGIHSALRMMYDGHFLNLPVIDEYGSILGLISAIQLTHAALGHQLSQGVKKSNKLEEHFVHVLKASELASVSEKQLSRYDESTNLGLSNTFSAQGEISQDNKLYELDDQSWNYFWKFFDTSDNEGSLSASSSQLSLVDTKYSNSNVQQQRRILPNFTHSTFQLTSSSEELQKKKKNPSFNINFEKSPLLGRKESLQPKVNNCKFRIHFTTDYNTAKKMNLPKYKRLKVKSPDLEASTPESFLSEFLASLDNILGLEMCSMTWHLTIMDGSSTSLESGLQLKNATMNYLQQYGVSASVPLTLEVLGRKKTIKTFERIIIKLYFAFYEKVFEMTWVKVGFSFFFGLQFGRLFY